jgi:hypothetical protein
MSFEKESTSSLNGHRQKKAPLRGLFGKNQPDCCIKIFLEGGWVCWAGKETRKTTTSPGDLSPNLYSGNLYAFYYSLSKCMMKVNLGDIACFP